MTPDDRPPPRHAEAIARGEAAWERIRAERDYSWSANPIHDALLAERLRAELEEWGQ